MKIVNLKTEQLIPYINNPRNNNDAVDKVAASIKEFGFKVPIVIDKDNVVVTGHTRLLASKKLGLQEVPCVIADDLSPAQIKAFRIADNKVSEYAQWDEDMLKVELEEQMREIPNFNKSFGAKKIFQRKEYSIYRVKDGFIIHNTNLPFKGHHTHIRSFHKAKSLVDLCRRKKLPDTPRA